MLHFNCPSPHCSRAAEIFHFRLIRIRSNAGSSIFRLHYAVEHELEKPLGLLWLYWPSTAYITVRYIAT